MTTKYTKIIVNTTAKPKTLQHELVSVQAASGDRSESSIFSRNKVVHIQVSQLSHWFPPRLLF